MGTLDGTHLSGYRPTHRMRDSVLCAVLLFAAFGFVYWRSLTFAYIEGDDAELVAYHALGRHPWLQPPYSPYVSMFDALLAILPPRQDLVLATGMGLTAFCAPTLLILITILAFDACKGILNIPKWPTVAVMLLAVPEFYYLGMVLTPSVVAMTLMVAAHLILRRSREWSHRTRQCAWPVSAALFGLGAAVRWDTILYGGTVGADILLGGASKDAKEPTLARFRVAALWGGCAAGVWLALVSLNGYGPTEVLRIIRQAGPMEPLSWSYGLSRIHTLLTPAFALSFMVGLVTLIRTRHRFALVILLAIALVSKLMLFGVPKWIITAIPALTVAVTLGVCLLWQQRAYRYALIGIAVAPWIVGVRMTQEGVAWGPDFSIQSYDSVPEASTLPAIAFGAGTAVPTPEGPRPLFGHAWVLAGEWKRFVSEYWLEQRHAVEAAIRLGLPVLLYDNSQGLGVDIYQALGFTGSDSSFRTVDDGVVVERRWSRADGVKSRLLYVGPGKLFEPGVADRLLRAGGHSVVILAFSSTMARLHKVAPRSLDQLGKVSAVLHLDRFSAALPTDGGPSTSRRGSER